jgi:arylsulfatase A-like enzyme
MTMVRSDQWKIVHFMEQDYGQLFNLADDPNETNDLWDQPADQQIKQDMLAVLREWRIRSQYDTADWSQDWR